MKKDFFDEHFVFEVVGFKKKKSKEISKKIKKIVKSKIIKELKWVE